jgi:hypothetical protein
MYMHPASSPIAGDGNFRVDVVAFLSVIVQMGDVHATERVHLVSKGGFARFVTFFILKYSDDSL